MAISGPKGAEPTIRGWVNPKTGELLKSQKITQAQIDEWHGKPLVEPTVEENDDIDLENLTKVELEELAREKGVELDRRKRKDVLLGTVRNLLSK